jgi:hypothetical protein
LPVQQKAHNLAPLAYCYEYDGGNQANSASIAAAGWAAHFIFSPNI